MSKGQKHNVIRRLNEGYKFGLYGINYECYFEDGCRVNYNDLWKAIKEIHDLKEGHGKSLPSLYPDTFEGIFTKEYGSHRRLRAIRSFLRTICRRAV